MVYLITTIAVMSATMVVTITGTLAATTETAVGTAG